ncbi:hypothetical protein JS278_00011 [Acidipropionibacterium virtanenii]|uniref:DUF3566 domain-containing protein n=1 Tax=Acidipropionibacterium virtanenii TaxID=2057246 RepID=A0A344UPL2_9ACTN|nr:DUF3566 domain-containing protein [Acidipropionibacterium virtanenii]AXE37210.1 hypothetical protein JS278_00011 [Acidipropionibacterium virtanenii]
MNPRKNTAGSSTATGDPDATHWTSGDAHQAFSGNQAQPSPPGKSPQAQQPKQAPGRTSPRTQAPSTSGSTPPPAPGGAVSGQAGVRPGGQQAAAPKPATLRTIKQTRKARLRISRIDPWSVMKTSLMFGVAGAIIFFIAVWVVWGVIGASGAFDSINKAVNDLIASPTSETKFQLSDYVNTGRVLGLSAIIGVVDAVLFTALATLFSFLYNLAAQVMGGLEVTLAED